MENTVALQLHIDQDLLAKLDQEVRARSLERNKRMSLAEWNKSKKGQEFCARLNSDPQFKAMSIADINRMQRELYHKDVPPQRGRPRVHDIRVSILKDALELYLKQAA